MGRCLLWPTSSSSSGMQAKRRRVAALHHKPTHQNQPTRAGPVNHTEPPPHNPGKTPETFPNSFWGDASGAVRNSRGGDKKNPKKMDTQE